MITRRDHQRGYNHSFSTARKAATFLVPLLVGLVLLAAPAFAGVGIWTTNGPQEGVGRYVIADPLHVGTLYAGGETGVAFTGPYKSTDDGQTWARVGSLFVNSPKPLATAPPNTVYFSGDFCGEATCNNAVYVSPDSGATWNQVTPRGSFLKFQMVIDPVTPATLFLAENFILFNEPTSGALVKSVDGGSTWVLVSSSLQLDHSVISAMIGTAVSGTLYVATVPGDQPNAPHGLFKTLDGGATWTPLPGAPNDITALAADPTNPSIVYAGTPSGLFKSVDGGTTFTQTNAGLTTTSVTSFAIDPSHPNRVYVGTGGGVFKSVDSGATWQSLNSGLTDLNVYSLAIDGNGGSLHAGTTTKVFDYQFPASTCVSDSHTLCLNNGRFAVTADFQQAPEGPSSPATAVPLTSDTGYFWFFDPANVETVAKVLNGCGLNGHYWFFASGLTNVGVQINVKDTFTGSMPTYSNSVGTPFAPIQDTAAFSTCP